MALKSVGLLIWWSTNTRACAVAAHEAIQHRVPTFIVVDPEVAPPSTTTTSRATVLERTLQPLSLPELHGLASRISESADLDSLVLFPSSEYLQTVVHTHSSPDSVLKTYPRASVPYLALSSKEWLATLERDHGLRVPARINAKRPPERFVAKPRENVKDGRTLKPFLVHDEASRALFDSLEESYFGEEFLSVPSIYWCAYRGSEGRVTEYFQRNLLQAPGGGSIAFARHIRASSLPNPVRDAASKLRRFLAAVDYVGPIMAELRGETVTELNPRFWGPLSLDQTSRSGVLQSFLKDSLGIQPTFSLPSTRFYVVPKLARDATLCEQALMPPTASLGPRLRLRRAFARLVESSTRGVASIVGGDF